MSGSKEDASGRKKRQLSEFKHTFSAVRIAVVTLQTFTQVKLIYLGQLHQKSPEVNSFRVLFYLGKNSGKVTLLISATKVFTPVEFFGAYIQEGKMRRDLADQRDVFSFISLLFLTLSQRAR